MRSLFLLKHLLHRPYPHGLSGWGFLYPGGNGHATLHRRLWWQGRPRRWVGLWILLEGGLCLRWHCFELWRAAWRAIRYYGPTLERQEGISLGQQARCVLTLGLRWGIPPADAYIFRLIQRPETALDFVYSMEAGSHHRWRSLPLGLGQNSLLLLQDKWRQTEQMSLQGVPMAPILALVPRGTIQSLHPWLQQGKKLFCKTRSGNRGKGAFAVWREEEHLHGWALDGRSLHDQPSLDQAWQKLLAMDDVLIQPLLIHHPRLALLAVGEGTVVVRFISHWQDGRLACLCALLELPAGLHESSGRRRGVSLPLSDRGCILPVPQGDVDATQPHYLHVQGLLTEESSIPHWQSLVAGSFRAHALFTDVWAIAWDWVVTLDGPILLEGNAGWGPTTPQAYFGPLLPALPIADVV